nr:chaperone protein dnaj 1, mitochondrial [Quercus suber]
MTFYTKVPASSTAFSGLRLTPTPFPFQHKKELALGFVILNKDLSAMLSESNEFGGFTLIRLMSSGKLESQSYCASWKLKELHTERFHFKDNSLYIMDDEEYNFPRRFKYVKLSAYLNGSLTEVLVSKLKKPCKGHREKESFSSESHEILCEKLKACGFGRLRSPPAVSAVVFNDISSPASIHEVALRRLWAGLPMELLQLAYSNYSEFLEVLLDQKKVSLEFLVVPDLPQLPPFFLRRPSCRSNKWSHKVQRDDALVGPVLPLPILLTLHEYRNGHSELDEEAGVFSLEREISLQCDETKQVAHEMALSDSSCELHGDQAVSLADEREDMWGSFQKPKPFCLYHPVAFKCSTMDHVQDNVFKDEKFDNLIFKVLEKKHFPNGLVETVGPELFDDLCPADLRFDTSAKNFGPNELKIYKKRTQGKENVEYAAGDAEGFRYAYRTHFSDSFHKIFSEIFEEEADPFVSDIQVKLSLSFSEAVKGCTKDLSFDAFVPCDSCYGRGYPPDAKTKVCPTCRGTGSGLAESLRNTVCHVEDQGRLKGADTRLLAFRQ